MLKIINYKKLILITIFILLVSYLPNYLGYFINADGYRYMGLSLWFNAWDINIYISAIKWAQEFGWQFQNLYTSIPHGSVVIYPLYTLTGAFFRNSDQYTLYHLLSLMVGTLLIAVFYKLILVFLKKENVLYALVLILLGGGFGWLSANFFLPDTSITPFTFADTLQKPHEGLAIIFYFSSLTLFFLGASKKNYKYSFFSILCFIPVILFYPYYLLSFVVINTTFLLYQFFSKKMDAKEILLQLLLVSLLILPTAAYGIYLMQADTLSNVFSPYLATPNILLVFLGYGVFSLLVIYQLVEVKKSIEMVYLNIWFFSSLILSYVPLSFSRYYLRGLFFPIILLSIYAINPISKRLNISVKSTKTFVLFFGLATSLVIFSGRLTSHVSKSEWSYLTTGEMEALKYIKLNTKPDEAVLAPYPLSNIIPAFTGRRVYFGHFYQTPDSADKIELLENFYTNEIGAPEALGFTRKNNVELIMVLPEIYIEESDIKYDFLKKIFEKKGISIFSTEND